jgi:hypothetical protein
MIPQPTVEHYKRVQRLQSVAMLAARRAWRSVDAAYISESWSEALPEASAALSVVQEKAATLGASYGADTLASQGLYEAPQVWVNPSAFAGVSSRGFPLEAALYSAAPHVKGLIAGGMDTAVAMRSGSTFIQAVAQTQVSDAARGAAGVDTFARPNVGYVRMLNPPSCSRCSVLAGRFYKHNAGFLRHPRCDCVHVQTTAAKAANDEGLFHDPYAYFESLSAAEQDRLYTKAGAQAIRDGSDLFQVVNSRRGMSYAGESKDGTRRGQRAVSDFTREGTGRRGNFRSLNGGKQRLTPEAIYAQGLPREVTLDQLRRNGYLLRQGQVSEGAIRGLGPATSRSTLTAADQRVQRARLQWEAVQEGRNPFGKGPLTPQGKATAENNYRRWLLSGGQIYTR